MREVPGVDRDPDVVFPSSLLMHMFHHSEVFGGETSPRRLQP